MKHLNAISMILTTAIAVASVPMLPECVVLADESDNIDIIEEFDDTDSVEEPTNETEVLDVTVEIEEIIEPEEVEESEITEETEELIEAEVMDESEPSELEETVSAEDTVIEIEEVFDECFFVNGYTRSSAVAWANAKIGKTYSETPDDPSFHLISNYVEALGDWDFYGNYWYRLYESDTLPNGWTNVYWNYQPGDIVRFSYDSNGKTKYRNGIILSCDEYGFYSADPVFYSYNNTSKVEKIYHRYTDEDVSSAIRPDFPDALVGGWRYEGYQWHYYKTDGSAVTGDQTIDGRHYYFNSDGTMFKGWRHVGAKWYYYGGNGYVTGWNKIGKTWYYFNTSGVMLTGWQKISNSWYYFDSNGKMLTGWQKLSGKWYYFGSSGVMKTGWVKSGGKWYYFDSSGRMVTGTRRIGNRSYTFNSNGVCTNP